MSLLELAFIAVTCLVAQQPDSRCLMSSVTPRPVEASSAVNQPSKVGEAVDVVLTAEAAIVWDLDTGTVLYTKNERVRRPVASLSKLLAALAVRDRLPPDELVTISPEAVRVQRLGAHISLPAGEHATVAELVAAALIASANDAMVALATAAAGSEAAFVEQANAYAASRGLADTRLSNATGLSGGAQYSTAADVRQLLNMVYADAALAPYLRQETGVLTTREGKRRRYATTNQLASTYLPILAAKTGYTTEAGENLAIITAGSSGQEIGAVILGSADRFQDMKILVEWIWRNYQWP